MVFKRGDLILTPYDIIGVAVDHTRFKPLYDGNGLIYKNEQDSRPTVIEYGFDNVVDMNTADTFYKKVFLFTLTLPQWAVNIMNTSQTPITSNIPATSTPPPTGYPIGTVLHGTNQRIGNLWIITLDNSYQASLLYEGKRFFTPPDSSYKRDTMSPGMRIATSSEILAKVGLGGLPSWAQAFYFGSGQFTKPTQAPKYILLKMGIVQRDLGITPLEEKNLAPAPTDTCKHVKWQPYYGLTESYEFCTTCDKKRTISK